MKLKKITNDTEKKIIILMMDKDYETYAEIARDVGISKPWAKKMINRFKEYGLISEKVYNKKVIFCLNKKRVILKKFSFELLKQLIMQPTIGMMLCFSTSFLFGVNAMISIIGGMQVFLPQFLYSFYKIYALKDAENIDIFIKVRE